MSLPTKHGSPSHKTWVHLAALITPLHTTTTLADKRLAHSSNVEMCYTTKTKVYATLSFQRFGQKIRTCSTQKIRK